MIGLDKIYLHHSVYPNKTTLIDCAGHHNSSGGNGSGKTTLQKLIPIFYGEQVNKVVPTQVRSTKESFIKYYLKSEASFVAFEYTNPTGKCAVVLHKKNEHLRYRFIKGALTDFLYTPETLPLLQKGLLIHDFFKALSSEKHPVSQIISTAEDYRAILQNDKVLLRTRQQTFKGIHTLANEYSLPGVGSHMQLMHKLTYALQSRTSMFSGLEDMIISTQFDFVTPEKPKHIDNTSLTDDLKSLHDFDANEKIIRHALSTSLERLHAQTQTSKLSRSLYKAVDIETAQKEKLTTDIQYTQDALSQLQADHQNTLDRLTSEKTEAKSRNTTLAKRIDHIHNEKDRWENSRNIQFKKDQYAQIDSLRQNAHETDNHYKALTDGISQERAELQSRIAGIETTENKQLRQFDQHIKQAESEQKEFSDSVEEKKHREQTLAEQKREGSRQQFNTDKEVLIIARTEAEMRAKQAANTGEEQIAEDVEEQAYLTATEKEKQAQVVRDEAFEKIALHTKNYDDADAFSSNIKLQLNQHKEEEQRIHQRRYPDSKSFLAYLGQNKPHWQSTLGKVIDPALLNRTDLSPANSDQQNEDLYGIAVSLDHIDLPQHAKSDAQLEELHKSIEYDITHTEKRLHEQESKQQKILADKNAAEQYLRDKDNVLKAAEKHKDVSHQKWRQVLQQNKQQRINRQLEAKTETQQLNKSLQTRTDSHDKDLSRIKELLGDFIKEHVGLVHTKNSEVTASIKSINAKKTAAQEKTKVEINDLNTAFKQACANKGLDEAIEKAAKKRWGDAKAQYQHAQDSVDEIRQYDNWLKSDYKQLSEFETERLKSADSLRIAENKLKAAEDTHKAAVKAEKKSLDEQRKALKTINDTLTEANDILQQVGDFPEGSETSDETDTFKLTALLRAEQTDYKKRTEETLNAVKKAQRLIEKREGSRIYEQWTHLYHRYESTSPYDELDDNFLLNLPPLLDDLVNNHVPHIKRSTLETIIAVAGQIENYYQELKNIGAEISRVSNRLSNRINTNQQIKALSDISIRLVSNVEECGAWNEMANFSNVWENCSLQIARELPPEALGDALSDVIKALEYAHATPDLKSLISLAVTLKENGNYKEITSDQAMNDASSNGLSLLAVIAIYIGMSRYLCPDESVSLTWPVDELSTIDLDNIASLFSMLDSVNIRLFSAFPTKEHNILKHFDTCHELDFKRGAMSMAQEVPRLDALTSQLQTALQTAKSVEKTA